MSYSVPRDIQHLIYDLVLQQDRSNRRHALLATRSRDPSAFLVLARVDRWSYAFVTNSIYESSLFANSNNVAKRPSCEYIKRLITIANADLGKGIGDKRVGRIAHDDPHVWPYLQRYNNLRRITSVRLSHLFDNLPWAAAIDAFLRHIGEAGPLFRHIELRVAVLRGNDGDRIPMADWKGRFDTYRKLFDPHIIVFEGAESALYSHQTQRLFRLAKVFPNVPIRVPLTSLQSFREGWTKNDAASRQPRNTRIQYILKTTSALQPANESGPHDIDPELEPLFSFIRRHAIGRPAIASLQIDIVLPHVNKVQRDRLMAALVKAELQEDLRGKQPRLIHYFCDARSTGRVARLRDAALFSSEEKLDRLSRSLVSKEYTGSSRVIAMH